MSTTPSVDRADVVVARLVELMETRGSSRYDDAVTQCEHAVQAAVLAAEAQAPAPLVVATLLHDVGHLLLDEHDGRADFLASDRQHEAAGARFLQRWFPAEVFEPVALHAAAKRYLVAIDPGYATKLSTASRRSLAVQGGPLLRDAIRAFEATPHAAAAVRLRRWDDAGKRPGRRVPPFGSFGGLVSAVITRPRP